MSDKTYEIEIIEKTLPIYLQKDIEALKKGRLENSSLLDCLYSELYGSINSALYSYEKTDELAELLRKKYL